MRHWHDRRSRLILVRHPKQVTYVLGLLAVEGAKPMTTECPECAAPIPVGGVVKGEILRCPDCGADLEVIVLEPIALALAPREEEDWGE